MADEDGSRQHSPLKWRISIGADSYVFDTAALHMGNREAYTLSATNLAPEAAANSGAAVTPCAPANPSAEVGKIIRVMRTASMGGYLRFWTGVVVHFKTIRREGRIVGNHIRAASGWYFFERWVYTQQTMAQLRPGQGPEDATTSRIVIGQDRDGRPISAEQQLLDIAFFIAKNAEAGGYAPNALDTQYLSIPKGLRLPYDEMRDATIAQILDRILRYCPDAVVVNRPTGGYNRQVQIFTPGSGSKHAKYLDSPRVLSREDGADDTGLTGVRVQMETTGSADGTAYRSIDVEVAGTLSPHRTQYLTLQLDGRDTSRTIQRLNLKTEPAPSPSENAFWESRFGETTLKGAQGLKITYGKREVVLQPPGAAWTEAAFPRIALNASPQELGDAGVRFAVEKWSCTASYATQKDDGSPDRVIFGQALEIEVVTTNGTTREYSWTSAYSATSAEPKPVGLAAALLAQASKSGRYIAAVLALPQDPYEDLLDDNHYSHDAWPGPGDSYDGLICQTADYDLASHTVALRFGPPSQIAPQDLQHIMLGGRTRKTTAMSQKSRATGEVDGEEIDRGMAVAGGGAKTGAGQLGQLVIQPQDGGAKINNDPAAVSKSDAEIKPRELKYIVKDSEDRLQTKKTWAMMDAPEDDGSPFDASGLPDGLEVWGRVEYYTGGSGPQFRQYKMKWNAEQKAFIEQGSPTLITMLEACDCDCGSETE